MIVLVMIRERLQKGDPKITSFAIIIGDWSLEVHHSETETLALLLSDFSIALYEPKP